MRIGMILGDKLYPPDIRVDKEAEALIKKGFEVGLLTPVNSSAPKKKSPVEGVQLYRAQIPVFVLTSFCKRPPRFTPWPRAIVHHILRWHGYRIKSWSSVLGIDGWKFWRDGILPGWYSVIEKFILEFKPDVLHVHDFILVPSTLEVAEKYSIPVVADLHENWPAQLDIDRQQPIPPDHIHGLNKYWSRKRCERLEKRNLVRCAKNIVVVPEAAERLLKYGIPQEKIHVVSNTEDESFDTGNIDSMIVDQYKDYWVASYIGGIGYHRGLETILEAIPKFIKDAPNFLLLVVGASQQAQSFLLGEAEKLGITKHIEIIGWKPSKLVKSYISASEICLVPHRNMEHTNTTVPHKLFQYMLMSKPVLVSSCPPLKRIVEETKSGCVFTADDSDDAAKVLLKMYQSNQLAEWGRNGEKNAKGKYSWKNDAQTLADLYKTF